MLYCYMPTTPIKFGIMIQKSLSAICLILLMTGTVFCQDPQRAVQQPSPRPLTMLVLGDSIMWGQGLKPEHKSWYQVKTWIEKHTGRKVLERIEAHSGAVIERFSATDNLTSANHEVNVGLPTIHDELDSAIRFYADGPGVDLVLVSGCANDVGLQNLLNASNIEQVKQWAETKCMDPVEKLLRRIATSFPVAQVIVTGYYPFFSEGTKNDFILKGLGRKFFKTQAGAPRLSSKEVFERLKINSAQWYDASNRAVAGAARRVNAEFAGGVERVRFARIDFPSGYSFAAPETRLWGFDRSPFRMALVILSFGKILLPTNDEMRKQRTPGCNEVFRKQPNDTLEQAKERKAQRLFCRYAALGHPNRKGAVLYANAITDILKSRLPASGP